MTSRPNCLPLLSRLLWAHLILTGTALGETNDLVTLHVEGSTTLTAFNRDGSVAAAGQQPRRFSLWVSDCQWAIRLYADTNMPGGISDISSDGTNTYVFVPDAGGTMGPGFAQGTFAQSGIVRPGKMTVFPFSVRTGPIWWGYCSSCIIQPNEEILDFMDLQPGKARVRVVTRERTKTTSDRIGSEEIWLYPTIGATDTNSSTPLAHLRPLAVVETNGLTVLTKYTVDAYYPMTGSNTAPQPCCEYVITADSFVFEKDPVPAVPQITKPALVSDYRTPGRGQYVANHWLTGNERRAVKRIPLAPEDVTINDSRSLKKTVLLVALALLPVLGIGVARLFHRGTNASRRKENTP